MPDKAHITPKVLKWARTTAAISMEDAASKAGVLTQRLEDWENGADQPTIRQAGLLAKTYRRPFALFFLPSPPLDFQPLQDFRRSTSCPLGTASLFIIRDIQQKQSWMREWFEENREEPLPFVGRFTRSNKPDKEAADILRTLKIDPSHYTETSPLKEWTTQAEANGIFISRTSLIHSHLKLDSDELQGFALADKRVPFVFVNSDDWDAAQLFTLVHELAHIWIAESGVSSEISPELKGKDKFHPVELFCNEVAAAALMPSSFMESLPQTTFISAREVFSTAKSLGVSSFAFLIRALNLDLISMPQYGALKKGADMALAAFLKRQEDLAARRKELNPPGGPDYYRLLANRNGHQFTRIVMDAFQGGAIQPTEASTLLNTPINNFPRLQTYL